MPRVPRGRSAGQSVAALLVLAVLSGCEMQARSPVVYTRDEAIGEYKKQAEVLTLPPGTSWPSVPPDIAAAPPSYTYQKGVGEQDAQLWWYCAWAKAALRSGSPEALQNLRALPTLSVWQNMDDSTHEHFSRIEADFTAGRRGSLRDHISANCEG